MSFEDRQEAERASANRHASVPAARDLFPKVRKLLFPNGWKLAISFFCRLHWSAAWRQI